MNWGSFIILLSNYNKNFKNICNFNLKFTHLLKSPSFIFGFIAIITLFIFYLLIIINYIQMGDKNNTLYIMSTMAQSQAAILAIIVSLTLVAVQISSQRFSPRITHVFLSKKIFWLLIGLFSFSILYDVLLIWVANDIGYKGTFFGILLMIFALISLFSYIKSVIETLEPSKVIKLISNDIKAEEIDLFLINFEKTENDPLIVISDIVNGGDRNFINQITIINGIDGLKTVFNNSIHHFANKYHITSESSIKKKKRYMINSMKLLNISEK